MSAALLMPYPSSNSTSSSTASSVGPETAGGLSDGLAASPGGASAAPAAPMRSTYALAMNAAGNLVAVGTTESYIRLLDPKSGKKVMKLKVRCSGTIAL